MLSILFALVFIICTIFLAFFDKVPVSYCFVYLVLSCSTFISYAIDKSAARHKQRRIPEKTLQLLAMLGGWPGALLAQNILRHKSKKQSFLIISGLVSLSTCLH
ncbi:MAG TPA: DUF1294 domain-containing protein [Methylophilus sp.]|uniref:DUF1294 domain-containing protein n=1 Tax=Methylophilus sp. TaxID=29541 RepID=UPI002C34207D|nr:DUF1294 domain-containing protein [Methylophilus sp.]HSH86778.1 DUF1294 domain-containing protein [Methylophilus sp.]